jgi:two-component system phosphate regulon sensor histidine kinase PhoR
MQNQNMLYNKNLSPKQLSLFTALVLALLTALTALIIRFHVLVFVATFVFVFTAAYLLILYAIKTYTNRQIKILYKLISRTKAGKKEVYYYRNILPEKNLNEVTQDVEAWAEQRKVEIEILKQNEVFRKEFLQNLSHELKTPIFSIQGYVETLIGGAINNPEVNVKFLERTSANIQRLVNLVDDLDEISKLETGELQLNPKSFIIQDLVKEVFELLADKMTEKGIVATIKKGCEQSITVSADKEKIRQVLINLVDNGIKYGKQNGTIEASFYKTPSKTVLTEITDNGIGIADEHSSRIFERFYRTDTARSRKIGGSGLGLAICKHIIEAHQQTIDVRSTPDVGSTFGFSLKAE